MKAFLAHLAALLKAAVPAVVGYAAAHPELIPPEYAGIAAAVIAAYTAIQTQANTETAKGMPGWASRVLLALSFRSAPDRYPPTRPDTAKRRAVIIGLTRVDPKRYGGWDGDCPGCDVDARQLRNFYESRGVEVPAFLLNESATIAAVENAIISAARDLNPETDLLIIENSSHGGQVRDTNGDEADGQDETICLFDGQWTDDRVAALLAKLPARLRVLFGSDSCHSGTNTRAAAPYRFTRRIRRACRSIAVAVRLMHFAGCSDANYSYGAACGGQWTRARLSAYRPGMTYREWFDAAAKRMPKNQVPLLTLDPEVGSFADETAL